MHSASTTRRSDTWSAESTAPASTWPCASLSTSRSPPMWSSPSANSRASDEVAAAGGNRGRVIWSPFVTTCRRRVTETTGSDTVSLMTSHAEPTSRRTPSVVDAIADAYFDELCVLSPSISLFLGTENPHGFDDYSPEGLKAAD